MDNKFFTILIVPEKVARVRRYKLPRRSLQIGGVLVTAIFVLSIYLMVDYIGAKKKIVELGNLRAQAKNQKIQIMQFASKIEDLEREMARLRQFDTKLRIITNLEQPTKGAKAMGIGGSSSETERSLISPWIKEELLVSRMHYELDRLKNEANVQEQRSIELREFLENQHSLLASTPSIWPTRGWITSGFGYRVYPFTGEKKMHDGLDIATAIGTPIIAPADGIVTYVGTEGTYGKMLLINHGYGLSTCYGHCSKIFVKPGQKVVRGEEIANVGNTGISTGPHLHYEVRVNGVPVNPENYLLN
ncbi:MAG: M23 family metallopeptidase [Deltaproteobacteria bacterium]|nr:MAG: M23 family metallopeptidase [Deltaproteobacteria bacterium]